MNPVPQLDRESIVNLAVNSAVQSARQAAEENRARAASAIEAAYKEASQCWRRAIEAVAYRFADRLSRYVPGSANDLARESIVAALYATLIDRIVPASLYARVIPDRLEETRYPSHREEFDIHLATAGEFPPLRITVAGVEKLLEYRAGRRGQSARALSPEEAAEKIEFVEYWLPVFSDFRFGPGELGEDGPSLIGKFVAIDEGRTPSIVSIDQPARFVPHVRGEAVAAGDYHGYDGQYKPHTAATIADYLSAYVAAGERWAKVGAEWNIAVAQWTGRQSAEAGK